MDIYGIHERASLLHDSMLEASNLQKLRNQWIGPFHERRREESDVI